MSDRKSDVQKRSIGGQHAAPGFFAAHGEKCVVSFVAVVALAFIFGAVGHEYYANTPDDLDRVMRQKVSAVLGNTPANFADLPVARDVGSRGHGGLPEILAPMPALPGIDLPLKRGEVEEYLRVRDARVFARLLLMPFQSETQTTDPKNPAGPAGGRPRGPAAGLPAPGAAGGAAAGEKAPVGSRPEGYFTAILTARVPRQEQAKLYREAFAKSRGYRPLRDMPQYVSFLVQRADVTDGDITGDEDPRWITPTFKVMDGRFERTVTLIEHSLWLAQWWSVPSPQEWVDMSGGAYVIPLELIRDRAGKRAMWRGFTQALPPLLLDTWDERVAGGFPILRNQEDGPGIGIPAGDFDSQSDILLRFFDFSIEERKRYRYRIALVLHNPNYGLAPSLLKDPKLAEGEYRFSGWSPPSEIVTITNRSAALAGPVRRGSGEAADSMTLILLQRAPELGAMVSHAFQNLQAGQLLDLRASRVRYEHLIEQVAVSLEKYDFNSGDLIVDLKPGKHEMLVLDSEGSLTLKGQRTADPANSFQVAWRQLERLHVEITENRASDPNRPFGDDGNRPKGNP